MGESDGREEKEGRREDERRIGEKEQLDVEGKSPTSTWLRGRRMVEVVEVVKGGCALCPRLSAAD